MSDDNQGSTHSQHSDSAATNVPATTASKKAEKADKKTATETAAPAGSEKSKGDTKSGAKKDDNKKDNTTKGMSLVGRLLLLLSLLIALAALALAGWMYREQYLIAEDDDLQSQLAPLHQQITDSHRALLDVQTAVASQREALAQLRSDTSQGLSDLAQRSQRMAAELEELRTVNRDDWLLAEAEYLLRLAIQRAQLSGDASSAAKLLASADAILRDLDDPALHGVRQQIAEDIAVLQTTADFDIEGRYLALAGLAKQAEGLTLYQPPSYQPEPVAATDSGWQDRLKNGFVRAWEKLRSYIRIRRHDQKFNVALAPEQEAVLRASLRMLFEQAQLALLAEQPALYRRSLEKAQSWIEDFYRLDDSAAGVVKEITVLIDAPVSAAMPDLSASLQGLKEYSQGRNWQREVSQ
ncbi:uroporphyrinogen-III C-methyltransferase [Spongiibacter nanhainus]|uniref:Uroporphyrinogen-III C-methyltransferase n=1 Tax=Spongiibacter nanhainus TaxID=2794344 RepID=A0A7T4R0I3_9GAMM|nr:uroporphyrinogen-III C-methyltransferase [Spongiibacter nanhainus]QQD18180.1 uroporphyrinogen-III C-methyltransferase [Spongiibacter nanhainus]